MPVEFIGIARTADRSETIAETGPAVQPEYLYHLAATSRLGVLLAHRPGARQAAVDRAGAAGNSTALVGSYEQVAESLLDYVAVGATTLLIRGYDPLLDAAGYGDLIRLVHEQVGQDIDGYRARVAA